MMRPHRAPDGAHSPVPTAPRQGSDIMSNYIVPDYLIYDELKRERERRIEQDRPVMEIPRYIPHLHETGFDAPQTDDHDDADDGAERGEVVIPMW